MYLYERNYAGLGQLPGLAPTIDRKKAVTANRSLKAQLGWGTHIRRLKAFINMSTVEVDEEEAFALAVAEWQSKHGLNPNGILNSTTFSQMRAAGALKGSSWWNRNCKTTPVSNGEFGTALKHFTSTYCVPDDVPKLLKGSTSFLQIVNQLDQKYIARVGPDVELIEIPEDWETVWGATADGRMTKGTHRGFSVIGRRMIEILQDFNNSHFSPAGSLEGNALIDTIWIRQPPNAATGVGQKVDAAEIGDWIGNIAHESFHAFRRVTRTGPPAAKLVDRVRDAIAEEILTRQTEAKIVSEIKKTADGGKILKTFIPPKQPTSEAAVQRDFFPSKLRRTYLEHFLLGELMFEAIRREKLDPIDIQKRDSEVEKLPLAGWRARKFSSDYSRLRFALRVIDFRWRQAEKLQKPNTPGFERLKEQVLIEHANAFFGGLIAYKARP
jgi:hypothetical protein